MATKQQKKKLKSKLKRSIAKQKESMPFSSEAVRNYIIRMVKEQAADAWESLVQGDPQWKTQFMEIFAECNETLLRTIRAQELNWGDLTEAEKRELADPVLQKCLGSINQLNAERPESAG